MYQATIRVVALLFSMPALAQSARDNALNHISQVMAIELECPEYEGSTGNLALLSVGYKIDLADRATAARITSLVAEHRAGLRAAGKQIGCMVGWGLYGPGGENVKGLLRRK
jgi:hypothetical protein